MQTSGLIIVLPGQQCLVFLRYIKLSYWQLCIVSAGRWEMQITRSEAWVIG